jgi:hypothetical protein
MAVSPYGANSYQTGTESIPFEEMETAGIALRTNAEGTAEAPFVVANSGQGETITLSPGASLK